MDIFMQLFLLNSLLAADLQSIIQSDTTQTFNLHISITKIQKKYLLDIVDIYIP